MNVSNIISAVDFSLWKQNFKLWTIVNVPLNPYRKCLWQCRCCMPSQFLISYAGNTLLLWTSCVFPQYANSHLLWLSLTLCQFSQTSGETGVGTFISYAKKSFQQLLLTSKNLNSVTPPNCIMNSNYNVSPKLQNVSGRISKNTLQRIENNA